MAPVVERHWGPVTPFAIAAEAELTLVERSVRTPGHLFGRVGFDLRSDDDGRLAPELHLDDLALTCEPSPSVLAPCYGAVADAARRHAPDLHGPVAAAMSEQFDRLVRGRRFGDAADPAQFVVERARVSGHTDGRSGWIRVGLLGRIAHP